MFYFIGMLIAWLPVLAMIVDETLGLALGILIYGSMITYALIS